MNAHTHASIKEFGRKAGAFAMCSARLPSTNHPAAQKSLGANSGFWWTIATPITSPKKRLEPAPIVR
jgi:hypothetical protein